MSTIKAAFAKAKKCLGKYVWNKTILELDSWNYSDYNNKLIAPLLVVEKYKKASGKGEYDELLAYCYLQKAMRHYFSMNEYWLCYINLQKAFSFQPSDPETRGPLLYDMIDNALDRYCVEEARKYLKMGLYEDLECIKNADFYKRFMSVEKECKELVEELQNEKNTVAKANILNHCFVKPHGAIGLLSSSKVEDDEKYYILYESYSSLGKPRKALKNASMYLERNPDDINLLLDCVTMCSRLGYKKKAYEYLERMIQQEFSGKLHISLNHLFFLEDKLWNEARFHDYMIELIHQKKTDKHCCMYYGDIPVNPSEMLNARLRYHEEMKKELGCLDGSML